MEFPKELEKFREKLERTYKTCNEIKFVPCETKPWESKIGGCPYLEKVEDYPKDENGNPMFFMAQINLEEMPPLEDFPTKGILQFYVVDDDDYGLEDPCKVIYIEEYSKDESKLLTKNPFEDKYIMEYPLFEKSGKAVFTQNREMIGYACNGFDEIREMIDEENGEEIDNLYDFCDRSGSKMGGYQHFVQNAPEFYENGTAEILLLQIDTDEGEGTCEIMFGDDGNCQFMISREDLLNKNFSNVYYDWACY